VTTNATLLNPRTPVLRLLPPKITIDDIAPTSEGRRGGKLSKSWLNVALLRVGNSTNSSIARLGRGKYPTIATKIIPGVFFRLGNSFLIIKKIGSHTFPCSLFPRQAGQHRELDHSLTLAVFSSSAETTKDPVVVK